MTHPSPGVLIELYFGEAPTPEREALEAHVKECEACAAFARELGGIERALGSGPDDAPPSDGLARVLARVAAVRPARARRAEWLLAVIPSTAAFLAGAWAIRTGGERLTALVPGASRGLVSPEVLGLSLAALGLVVTGALVTLALAPILILESHGRSS
jgi:anti-sigma factor RsiW